MQWCFGVPHSLHRCIGIATGSDQDVNDRRSTREESRPIGRGKPLSDSTSSPRIVSASARASGSPSDKPSPGEGFRRSHLPRERQFIRLPNAEYGVVIAIDELVCEAQIAAAAAAAAKVRLRITIAVTKKTWTRRHACR
jgi:hypothetical protein